MRVVFGSPFYVYSRTGPLGFCLCTYISWFFITGILISDDAPTVNCAMVVNMMSQWCYIYNAYFLGGPTPFYGGNNPEFLKWRLHRAKQRNDRNFKPTCQASFLATVCKTVRPMLRDRCLYCPVCLSVCDVGELWPNGWMDQDATW